MEPKKLAKPTFPLFLPHGWKTEVVNTLGVHPMTITRNIKRGKGYMRERIVTTAVTKYGEKRDAGQ
ncbi:MAG: hypothetical protein VB068_07855 [Petrimonas sp.]|nr:hypothetical protein [Petrimonas sp.]MEA4978946.1 hypothetical protein [Petrimonas sp.]MEA5063207.1 hypothetical protein [Petrimonas sp.]